MTTSRHWRHQGMNNGCAAGFQRQSGALEPLLPPISPWYRTCGCRVGGGTTMATSVTLLDLVTEVAKYARSDEEVIATVAYMVNSGRVRLCGNFKGARFDLDALTDDVAA